MKKHAARSRRFSWYRRKPVVLVGAGVFAVLGVTALAFVGAATYAANREAEQASLGGAAGNVASSGASGGSEVRFGGAPTTCGNTTVPVGKRQVFLGDFSTGNFSQWSNVQTNGYNGSGSKIGAGNARISIVRGDCYGKNVAKYTVHPGDSMAGGERSEVADGNGAGVREGDERWYEFSTKFPSDFPNPKGSWFIIMQWHSSEGSPPLAIQINNSGVLEVRNNRPGGQIIPVAPIIRGQYVNYVLHTKFSNDKNVGFVRMYVNGVEKLARTPFRNMSDSGNYLKTGIYRGRPNDNPVQTVYSTGVRVTAP